MAKARKKARKSVPRRSTKKTRRTAAKLKGRKVANRKTRKARSKPRTKAPKQGVIAGAVQTVTETLGLHNRLAGRNTFED
ncbi:MAG: hypothetical protein QOF09_4472 [Alphaproteobacteria bacterium]|jgi:hypothetical protein|nr:hypothetical protein [Alphaproteobacteria bacterium]